MPPFFPCPDPGCRRPRWLRPRQRPDAPPISRQLLTWFPTSVGVTEVWGGKPSALKKLRSGDGKDLGSGRLGLRLKRCRKPQGTFILSAVAPICFIRRILAIPHGETSQDKNTRWTGLKCAKPSWWPSHFKTAPKGAHVMPGYSTLGPTMPSLQVNRPRTRSN